MRIKVHNMFIKKKLFNYWFKKIINKIKMLFFYMKSQQIKIIK